ncbi:unnamed protein product [Natator depressus]
MPLKNMRQKQKKRAVEECPQEKQASLSTHHKNFYKVNQVAPVRVNTSQSEKPGENKSKRFSPAETAIFSSHQENFCEVIQSLHKKR